MILFFPHFWRWVTGWRVLAWSGLKILYVVWYLILRIGEIWVALDLSWNISCIDVVQIPSPAEVPRVCRGSARRSHSGIGSADLQVYETWKGITCREASRVSTLLKYFEEEGINLLRLMSGRTTPPALHLPPRVPSPPSPSWWWKHFTHISVVTHGSIINDKVVDGMVNV